jgi:hypothetical protein
MIVAVNLMAVAPVVTATMIAAAGTMIGLPSPLIIAPRAAMAGTTTIAGRPCCAGEQIARKYQEQ